MPRRKFSRLTNAQKQALRGELDAKLPVTELAKKYGVSRRTIYNHRNRWEERLPQSRSKVLTVRVSAEDMARLDALAGGAGPEPGRHGAAGAALRGRHLPHRAAGGGGDRGADEGGLSDRAEREPGGAGDERGRAARAEDPSPATGSADPPAAPDRAGEP